MAISDYLALVPKFVGDADGKLPPPDYESAVGLAVLRYSMDRPRSIIVDVAATEGRIPLPVDFEPDFSAITWVEYPIGQVPACLLTAGEDWALIFEPTGPALLLGEGAPSAVTMRIIYTLRHRLEGSTDTIPAHHREAVACWAAAVLCEQLASAYAANTAPTIQADRVDQTSPQRAYTQRAKDLRARYQNELGVPEKRNVAAGTVVVHRDRNSLGGPRLTHPLRPWRGTV